MRDILLQCSGLLAIAAALTHGVLTETKVFPRVTIEPQRLATLLDSRRVRGSTCKTLLLRAPNRLPS